MDNMIKMTFYDPYIQTFDAYPNISDGLRAQIEAWKKDFYNVCESQRDLASFSQGFIGSEIQVRYTDLVGKAAMEAMSAQSSSSYNVGGNEYVANPTREEDIIPVSAYLEQYREAYNEVKKSGYRKRGEAAYEKIFDVANRTDDMVEAQIIIEEERLLWKIVTEDTLDIYETILEAMDPLYEAMTEPISEFVDIYKSAKGDEELTYKLERAQFKIPEIAQKSTTKIFLAALLGTSLLNFAKGRYQVQSWQNDQQAREGLASMIASKQKILFMVKMLKDQFNLTFNDLVNDEFTKIWFLNPRGLDALNRIKRVMLPENLNAFNEIVDDIISGKSIEEMIKTPSRYVVYFDLDKKDSSFNSEASALAKEKNNALTYYKYLNELGKVAENVLSGRDRSGQNPFVKK